MYYSEEKRGGERRGGEGRGGEGRGGQGRAGEGRGGQGRAGEGRKGRRHTVPEASCSELCFTIYLCILSLTGIYK